MLAELVGGGTDSPISIWKTLSYWISYSSEDNLAGH